MTARTFALLAGCVGMALLVLMAGSGRWFGSNWDRLPTMASGDSYDDWRSGGSMPWPGGGPSPLPDGSRIVYSSPRSGRGDIYLWERASARATRLTDSDDFEGQPAFSPDGKVIAYQRQERSEGRWRIWIMNADGSGQRPISRPRRGNDSHPQFSADGKRIRFLRTTWAGGKANRGEFMEVDLATETEMLVGEPVAEQVADEGQIWEVGATWDMRVWIRNKSSGERRVLAEGSYTLLVNDESDVLYAGQYARGLFLIGVDGTNQRQVFDNPGYILMTPQRHSGSKVVLIVDGTLELWEVDTAAGTSQMLTRVD
jgi:dipeptidyl aminopeptidase/acylaminoacyl peptidase